ncbi:MAG: hypothetical protein ACHP7P_03735 [Terriglobales bacterium]
MSSLVKGHGFSQAAEKPAAVGQNQDSSGLKPLGMTKIKGFCGAAEAAPLQNAPRFEFFSSLFSAVPSDCHTRAGL